MYVGKRLQLWSNCVRKWATDSAPTPWFCVPDPRTNSVSRQTVLSESVTFFFVLLCNVGIRHVIVQEEKKFRPVFGCAFFEAVKKSHTADVRSHWATPHDGRAFGCSWHRRFFFEGYGGEPKVFCIISTSFWHMMVTSAEELLFAIEQQVPCVGRKKRWYQWRPGVKTSKTRHCHALDIS